MFTIRNRHAYSVKHLTDSHYSYDWRIVVGIVLDEIPLSSFDMGLVSCPTPRRLHPKSRHPSNPPIRLVYSKCYNSQCGIFFIPPPALQKFVRIIQIFTTETDIFDFAEDS